MLQCLFKNKTAISTVKILNSASNNIHFNLAIEQYLFEQQSIKVPYLFLWRNSPTIVIGRHQNPWKQCRIEEMKTAGVRLSRRKSGGGAVYQDEGNTCFSFLTPYNNEEHKTVNNKIIMKTFQHFGVSAEESGRNDIIVNGKKISGSAYRVNPSHEPHQRKALHHGTIMFNVNLKALEQYLNPNKKKLLSKGIDSVKSRVMNIQQLYPSLNHSIFAKQLQTNFINYYNASPQYQQYDQSTLKNNQQFNQRYLRHQSWQWVYGQCPTFQYSIEEKFDWGLIQITYNVVKGYIKEVQVYSDCIVAEFITTLKQELINRVKYDKEGLQELKVTLLSKFKEDSLQAKMAKQVCSWMMDNL